jgi:PAS domain S-box-containing protein
LDDNKDDHYLKTELYQRIKTDSSLFEWIERSALDGMWYWDLKDRDHEWLSPRFKQTFGYDRDEVPHHSEWWQKNIFPEDLPRVLENFEKHFNNPDYPFDQVVRYKHKDGSTVWVQCKGEVLRDSNGEPERMIGIHIDLTPLMNAKADLSESKNELSHSAEVSQLALDTSGIGTWKLNFSDSSLSWSDNMFAVYHTKKEDFKGGFEDWSNCVHPDDLPAIQKVIEQCIENNEKFDVQFRIVCPDGKIRHIRGVAEVFYNEDGSPESMLGANWDATEENLREERLIKSNEEQADLIQQLSDAKAQLLHSEKMASIGQLAAGVAHEINNPVGYINSNIGQLKSYLKELAPFFELVKGNTDKFESILTPEQLSQLKEVDIEEIQEDLSDIMNESAEGVLRIKTIVNDLKDFSHVREVVWEYADVHRGIESTLNIAQNELKYNTEVIKNFGDIPLIECVAPQLNQVFMNLFVNAAHAIENGGTLNITTSQDTETSILVTVEDSGKGMDGETIKKIFDPFFTTKEVGKGTGLGLSLSYGIITSHNGEISVESEVGKGTIFSISLPIKQPFKDRGEEENDEQIED